MRCRSSALSLIAPIIFLGVTNIIASSDSYAQSAAKPSPAVSWLMSDPVSMLDLGVDRAGNTLNKATATLEEEIKKGIDWSDRPENQGKDFLKSDDNLKSGLGLHELGYQYVFGYAHYNDDKGIFELGFVVKPADRRVSNDHRTLEELLTSKACINLLTDAHDALFLRTGSLTKGHPESYPKAAQLAVTEWFSHNGFERSNAPQGLTSDIVKQTFLFVKLSRYTNFDTPTVECSSPLAGGPVSIISTGG